mgnify:CR=1 FL=1
MKEEYVFPHNNWYLEFTEEERPIVDNWRINIIKFSNTSCPSNYIHCSGMSPPRARLALASEQITFAQFEQYVLNINKEPIIKEPEDYSYLIPILQKLKIN